MKLDFRTKFLATIIISTICISGTVNVYFPLVGLLLYCVPFLLLLLEKKYKTVIIGLLLLVIVQLLNYYLLLYYNSFLSGFLIFYGYIVYKMIPGIMMGHYTILTTKTTEMIASLRKMKLKDEIIIPLSVMFRFFYSIKQDYRSINEAMYMHNLTFKQIFFQPVRILEYKLVPLLLCSTQTADEVSISAMTRGMEVNQIRSSIADVKLSKIDYIFFLILFTFLGFYFVCFWL